MAVGDETPLDILRRRVPLVVACRAGDVGCDICRSRLAKTYLPARLRCDICRTFFVPPNGNLIYPQDFRRLPVRQPLALRQLN